MTAESDRTSLLARARHLLTLERSERRWRAINAGINQNADELIALTIAYLMHDDAETLTSARTVEAYALGIRQLLGHVHAHAWNLLQPRPQAPQTYVSAMLAEGRKPSGVQLKVAAASCLYRALRWADATDADPFRHVRIPRDRACGGTTRPAYTQAELRGVLSHCDVQMRFLLFLVAHAGLRIREALDLEWPDLDLAAKRLRVPRGKGRQHATVRMSAALTRTARAYVALYGPGGPDHQDGKRTTRPERVFRYATYMGARYHIEKAFRAADVPFRGFHAGKKYADSRRPAARAFSAALRSPDQGSRDAEAHSADCAPA